MNWLHYLVEANIYLGVFYLCYCLFLNNETHYLLGRGYLLFSCIISFVLPVTQLSVLRPVEEIEIEPVLYPAQIPAPLVPKITIAEPVKQITAADILFYAYIIGAVITLVVFAFRLYRLSLLMRKSHALYGDKYKLVQLNGDSTAFSFFNYLFIGTNVPQPDTIIAHELVHIRQKHSADIVFVELIKVACWFNPLIYLLQRSLRTIHEYIADEQTAAREQDALAYSSFLLHNAYGLQGSPIAHSFFNYNLLKKRIIMLNQQRSGKLARLKYLAAVPLCAGMLCASTLVFSKDYAFIDLSPAKKASEAMAANTIKYFKIVDKANNITTYADNLSFTHKGTNKTYLAKSTTAADIAYIEKTVKLTVEVIDVDSKTLLPISAAKADTAFAMRPPVKFGKGYTLQENDYLIDKKTPYITVTIKESGAEKIYNSTDATSAERKMLKDKYGFEFKKDEMMAFWKMTRQSDKAFSTNPKLPPPPPPVAQKNGYSELAEWVSQKVKYPKDAVEQKLSASLVAAFTLSANGRISDVTVTGSDDKRFTDAVKEGIAKFPNVIKAEPGKKKMAVTLFVLGDKVPAIASSLKNSPEFIGETGVVGITAEQRKEMNRKLPPPPPPAIAPKPAKVGVTSPKSKIAPPVVMADAGPKIAEIRIDPPTVVADAKPKLAEVRIDAAPAAAPKLKLAPVKEEIVIEEPAAAPSPKQLINVKPKPVKTKEVKLSKPALAPKVQEIEIVPVKEKPVEIKIEPIKADPKKNM
ncbi:M56 family metallopeptidase [Mucilaginibacter pedocola]|uniref:TonB C-terminal domain-containing protein n=1 Tax=Mucilaginibacter pedocola TaxID=1792845 RepID=A0A1S9P7G2_9SPHI|nr:M56 family metallopeptidase [Mucilaginibacter pedocola]OOQ56891.1 hypothetical protein BC343_18105 [Mucilaginibacter pedocola]